MVAVKFTFLLALCAEALAAPNANPTPICSSKYGTVSIPSNKIPRATTTVKTQVTVLKKIIRKVNVIVVPQPKTTTETTTVQTTVITTANPNVKTATSTVTADPSTQYIQQSQTVTQYATSYTTNTKYTTSSVPAPSGFHPIKEYGGYVARRAAPKVGGDVRKALLQSQYVQRIDCTKRVPHTTIKTTTTTIQGPRKTLAPKTNKKTVTTTQTDTSTIYPDDITTTVTSTETPTVTKYQTATSYTTSTETVTVETVLPAVGDPVYAACDASNLMVTANGDHPVPYVDMTIGFGIAVIDSAQGSAYKCCGACMQNPLCLLSFMADADGSCTHLTAGSSGVCPNGQVLIGQYKSQRDSSATYHWLNGPCGYVQNGGEVS